MIVMNIRVAGHPDIGQHDVDGDVDDPDDDRDDHENENQGGGFIPYISEHCEDVDDEQK